ncbi:gamma-glutamyltranspeptidase [bacterium MnTg02]|nr:gamma-glutamyltranspeptidase [bacterium MnTg02]
MTLRSFVLLTSLAISLTVQAFLPVHADTLQAEPEAATGRAEKKLVHAKSYMAVAANPLASKAAAEILAQGGSAIDAAIAAQMVLTLVEPQSSGIGGGAFILHWDAGAKALKTYDGRETAPASARPNRFLAEGGRLIFIEKAMRSGLSVGVPGLVRLLELAHRRHGKLPWRDLFLPAIKLADSGFPVSPRLHKLLSHRSASHFGPTARAYFYDEYGRPRPVGIPLKNPALAQTFRRIAAEGAKAFYQGEIAQAIIDRLQRAPISPSGMTLADLANYRAKERPPVCIGYRDYKICGMGPPSSGGYTVAQTLKLLEPFNLGAKPLNVDALHVIAEAEKLAYADRNRYMADSDFVTVPGGLLDEAYLVKRRKLINLEKAATRQSPGSPPDVKKTDYGRDATVERAGTSHISVFDAAGNAVSMTTTIESGFGARMMVGGFLLNNELTDFSFRPQDKDGRPIANRLQPGKRPRSSMAPTIVFDAKDEPVMILGSPGGNSIILYVIKSLIGLIDWKLNAQSAAALANFGNRNNGPFAVEPDALTLSQRRALFAKGHRLHIKSMTSGTHIIVKTPDGLTGGADPRREGLAVGD